MGGARRDTDPRLAWVVLTMGDRPEQLRSAVESLVLQDTRCEIFVFANGASPESVASNLEANWNVIVEGSDTNLGVPGGRRRAAQCLPPAVEVVGFLDDDASVVDRETNHRILEAFDDAATGAVSLRLVDEAGETSRRHVPRPGSRSASESGDVVGFLGGACALKRSACDEVGGYWSELWYGHEELDLSWRLADAGYRTRYLADVRVRHPRTDINRHAEGWRLTGRNRVRIARRNLPFLVMVAHVTSWLLLGVVRARAAGCARAYFDGWRHGWSGRVDRRPIRWRTVFVLARRGRPPIV